MRDRGMIEQREYPELRGKNRFYLPCDECDGTGVDGTSEEWACPACQGAGMEYWDDELQAQWEDSRAAVANAKEQGA